MVEASWWWRVPWWWRRPGRNPSSRQRARPVVVLCEVAEAMTSQAPSGELTCRHQLRVRETVQAAALELGWDRRGGGEGGDCTVSR